MAIQEIIDEKSQNILIFRAIDKLTKDIEELKIKVNELWVARPKNREIY